MIEPLWTLPSLVAASGGVLDGTAAGDVRGVSIDTRTLRAGDLFVALKDQRDGHDFIAAAFAAGAAAALVAATYARRPGDGPLIRVDDTLRGLERIGVAARDRLSPDARVVAVTGSAGKTTTKEMLRSCLATLAPTHAADKSFNNHWGVPLTLARMPAGTRFAVFEIGMNNPGEIAPLSRLVRPDIAIVTNVLPVHIGNFVDGEIGIANAKAEIFAGLVPGGTAVIPRDNPHYPVLAEAARRAGARIASFGREAGASVRLVREETVAGGNPAVAIAATLADGNGRAPREISYGLAMPGRHNASNTLAVVAALDALGLDLDAALAPLAALSPPDGRGARHELATPEGVLLLIDEAYNANPASMAAAIETMAEIDDPRIKRKIAVLGDMLELGEQARQFHLGLEAAIDGRADLVFACGPMMRHLHDALPPDRRGGWQPDAAQLEGVVLAAVGAGDAVMVKASNGSGLGRIVAAIKKRFASADRSV
ncbi:MAG: UDP-N-acetylmuramoyl-tripeptide--D-alanyl-D-alanine ligase [Hyphomicrobiaceae bacterium]|nr:UDP-N-acetylmuramoyl-tripeptide--D-alanyl-D-alanine ligase [Hyphomicrobiaceae bacterium]